MTQPHVFFWVQHLLGLGHLARAFSLCEAFVASGMKTTLALGGQVPPGVFSSPATEIIQLPVARARDLEMDELIDEAGIPVDRAWHVKRAEALFSAVQNGAPDIFLTEAFPFGRRMFRFELLPVLQWLSSARPQTLIAASLRDIVIRPRKPGRAQHMAALAQQYFDLILVHGDRRVANFSDHFPEAAPIAARIVETGYVAPKPLHPSSARSGILVSAGGGAVGAALIETALAAARSGAGGAEAWTLVAGPMMPDQDFQRLARLAPSRVTLLRMISNLKARYADATLAIAQGGYNSVVEALSQGCRLIVVPFETEKETEQWTRAERLEQLGLALALRTDRLTPETLSAAIGKALGMAPPRRGVLDWSGATRSAGELRAAWLRKQALP